MILLTYVPEWLPALPVAAAMAAGGALSLGTVLARRRKRPGVSGE